MGVNLKVQPQSSLQEIVALSLIWSVTSYESLSQNHQTKPLPNFMTYRNYEILSVHYLKPLNIGITYYTAINNTNAFD